MLLKKDFHKGSFSLIYSCRLRNRSETKEVINQSKADKLFKIISLFIRK